MFCDLSERCAACTWRFDASAIYLHRANPSNVPLLNDPLSGASFVNASDMEFPYRVGPRLAFVVTDCAGLGLELNYFSVDGWSASKYFTNADFTNGFASLNVDSIVNNYPVTDAHVDFASMLHSSEINLRQRCSGNLTILTGFRWVDMFDRYDASGTSFITGNTLSQKIETRNHIFAWQSGLEGRLFPSDGPFQIGAFVKAGGARTMPRRRVRFRTRAVSATCRRRTWSATWPSSGKRASMATCKSTSTSRAASDIR